MNTDYTEHPHECTECGELTFRASKCRACRYFWRLTTLACAADRVARAFPAGSRLSAEQRKALADLAAEAERKP